MIPKLFVKPELKILITRTDRIGDLVLSTPVFAALRQKFPRARLDALTFLENREILEGNPFLNDVLLYDKKGSENGILGQWFFSRRVAAKKYDMVIHLHATNRMHVMSWLARIPVRIGWDRKCAWALTHRFPDVKKEGLKHEAEYNFDLLAPLAVSAPSPLTLFFPVPEKAERSFGELAFHLGIPPDRPWVVLSPSASCPSKRWPAERFGELADKIASAYHASILVIGRREDGRFFEKMKGASSATLYDLTGRLSLSMTSALLKKAALLVSNDSGPVHIAAAVGTPVLSIFGRNQPGLSPTRWRPLGESSRMIWQDVGCRVCLAHECQIHFLCLDVLSVDRIFKEVETMLAGMPLTAKP